MAGIKRLRHSLNDFMRDNPPVSESELARITELAHRLGSSKVKEAEHVNSRCAEAKVMLRNRQNQIRGAEKFMVSYSYFLKPYILLSLHFHSNNTNIACRSKPLDN